MLPRLRRRLDRMERQRLALLEEVARLDGGQLGFRPSAESWSTLDVVEHLVRVEEAVVLRASQQPRSRSTGQAARAALAMVLTRLLFRAGIRVKAPVKSILPQGTATLPELCERWDRVRGQLEAVLADQTAADLRRPLMRHPRIGSLSPVQTLRFFECHVDHHRNQLERIRSSPGFVRQAEMARAALHRESTEATKRPH